MFKFNFYILIIFLFNLGMQQRISPLESADVTFKTGGFHSTLAFFNAHDKAQLDNDLKNFTKLSQPPFDYDLPLSDLELLASFDVSSEPILNITQGKASAQGFNQYIKLFSQAPPTLERPWYLVIIFAGPEGQPNFNPFDEIENFFRSKKIVKTTDGKKLLYVPHVTIATITKIKDFNRFLSTIYDANKKFRAHLSTLDPRFTKIKFDRLHLHTTETTPTNKDRITLTNSISNTGQIRKRIDEVIQLLQKQEDITPTTVPPTKRCTIEPAQYPQIQPKKKTVKPLSTPPHYLYEKLKQLQLQLIKVKSIF